MENNIKSSVKQPLYGCQTVVAATTRDNPVVGNNNPTTVKQPGKNNLIHCLTSDYTKVVAGCWQNHLNHIARGLNSLLA